LHWPLEFPEVFSEQNGFDAIMGNPPFMGGQMITGALGTEYRNYLVERLANGRRGSADLCAYFFLRARHLTRNEGGFSMLATNTIAQGDTREVGLDQLTQADCVISRAVSSQKWPGSASLEVSVVCLRRGSWNGSYVLDENPVSGITPYLTKPGEVAGNPYRLAANAGKSFQGSIALGKGFILTPEEAEVLLNKNAHNRDVIFPYLNGDDLNSRPDQSPSRWVINFFDWPLKRGAEGAWECADKEQRKNWMRAGIVPDDYPDPVAADYPDCLAIVVEKVKPERQKLKRKVRRERWWQFAERAPALYSTIAGLNQYLIHPLTGKHHSLCFYKNGIVASHMTVVLAFELWESYCILQCGFHWEWVLEYGNKIGKTAQYTPTDCFETFPFPYSLAGLNTIGESYYMHLSQLMIDRQEGLTKAYNRFHNPDEIAEDIQKLRNLRVEMDYAVAAAYGWADLDFDYDFHETKQGLRFTISEPDRREVLACLLKLNHERYAQEVSQGLHN
jgi:hypothetical protein